LSRAYAYPDCAIARVAFTQFKRERQDVSSSGGAERMPDGHRAAVGRQLLVGNGEAAELFWKFPKHPESLRAEGLVDFPNVDLLGGQAGPLDRQRQRPRRGQPHDQRVERVHG
jgi:hypothetical protein